MKNACSKWLHSVLGLCLVLLVSSCAEDTPTEKASEDRKPYIETTHTVSIETAEKQLTSLLKEIEGASTRSGDVSPQRKIATRYSTKRTVGTRTSGKIIPYIHVFNFEGRKGFAIMSGDDRTVPLLALAFTGELTPRTEVDNPGLVTFLVNMEHRYAKEIEERSKEIRNATSSGNRIVYGPWETRFYGMNVGNCYVQWGQSSPYNIYCPQKNGEQTLTGCVATAVAQLMSTYKHPTSYGGNSFNWDTMNKHISTTYPHSPAHEPIARLMQLLGSEGNLNTSYGTSAEGGSGADPKNIPRTLINFGYSSGGILIDYSTDAVVNELKKGYHLLIGGYEARQLHKKKFLGITIKKYYTYSGGHRWLAHGLLRRIRTVSQFDSSNRLVNQRKEVAWYPLCNFGWDGYGDGYYLSGAFDTNNGPAFYWNGIQTRSSSGTEACDNENTPNNFQYKMTAVIGIRK